MGENHVRNAATYESQQIKSSIQDQAFTRDVIKMRMYKGRKKYSIYDSNENQSGYLS